MNEQHSHVLAGIIKTMSDSLAQIASMLERTPAFTQPDPVQQELALEPTPAPQEAPAPQKAPVVLELSELSAELAKIAQQLPQTQREKLSGLITAHGVSQLSQVDPKHYPQLLADAKALL